MTDKIQAKVITGSLGMSFSDTIAASLSSPGFAVFNSPRYVIFPGFCDVHVHFREPGFSYKETMETGSRASARGGYTTVCTMPNLNPVPDSLEHLNAQLERIRSGACIQVVPYGAITVGERGETLADLEAMAPYVAGFSDDGRGVQSEELMRQAMLRAKALGKPIVAHCEDNSLLRGGYIHDGAYAKAHGHRGICSESEWGPIARDLKLVKETGVSYHVCHISTKESVELIRQAKAEGLDVTCETGPHYLVMDDSMLEENGRFKMNPPLRSKEDREALVQGLLDGILPKLIPLLITLGLYVLIKKGWTPVKCILLILVCGIVGCAFGIWTGNSQAMDADGNTIPGGYNPLVEWYDYPEPAPAEKTGQQAWDALTAVVTELQDGGIVVTMPE